MPYAVNLTLDAEAALAIERIQAALPVPNHALITQYGACVTLLVVGDAVAPDLIQRILAWKLPDLAAVDVILTDPCILAGTPPTLGLRVSANDRLFALHNAIFTELPEADVQLHYRPAYWQPHVKLANAPGGRAAEAVLLDQVRVWSGLAGVLDRLEVMQYPPVQPIWQARLAHLS